MLRTQLFIAFLLGAVVALGAALIAGAGRGLPEAHAQSSGNNDLVALMGTMTQGRGPNDNIYIIDSKAMRLAVYRWNGQTLEVGAVRNLTYDFKFEEFPGGRTPQKPTVADMRDATRNEDQGGPKKPK